MVVSEVSGAWRDSMSGSGDGSNRVIGSVSGGGSVRRIVCGSVSVSGSGGGSVIVSGSVSGGGSVRMSVGGSGSISGSSSGSGNGSSSRRS